MQWDDDGWSGQAVNDKLREMYGVDLGGRNGVVHVAAVWAEPGGGLVTLRINADTPRSGHDFFALNATRARADAIVLTGKILRDEPVLSLDPQGPGRTAAALRQWRRRFAGLTEPPVILVLTGGRDLAIDHPIWAGEARFAIYTTTEAAARLRPPCASRGIAVVSDPAPDLLSAITYLRDSLSCRTIAIEAGPSTANTLYRDPLTVDELVLSIFDGDTIPESVRGPAFVPLSRIEEVMSASGPGYSAAEESGSWRHFRFVRRSPRTNGEEP